MLFSEHKEVYSVESSGTDLANLDVSLRSPPASYSMDVCRSPTEKTMNDVFIGAAGCAACNVYHSDCSDTCSTAVAFACANSDLHRMLGDAKLCRPLDSFSLAIRHACSHYHHRPDPRPWCRVRIHCLSFLWIVWIDQRQRSQGYQLSHRLLMYRHRSQSSPFPADPRRVSIEGRR